MHGDWMEDIKPKINGNNDSYLARLENWEQPTTVLVFLVINFKKVACKFYLMR
jgi:hypothetical protein